MKRLPSMVPAAAIFLALYAFLHYGIAPLTQVLTGTRAPLPSSLTRMYTAMAAVAILLYFSVRDDRWRAFIAPPLEFLGNPEAASSRVRMTRKVVLVAVPLLLGWQAYRGQRAAPEPPADPPGIHFNLPDKYLALENPVAWSAENIRQGGVLYTMNCAMCHGDTQEGNGLFARALQPRPANFRDTGTIAQLDQNYLFWRIREGGPGLPRGSIEYRSAMPVWGDVLTNEQIWKIIMFEYTNAGVRPAVRE